MGSFIDDDEECGYFDADENLASCADSCSDCEVNSVVDNNVAGRYQYDVWVKAPMSVRERRMEFFTSMGLSLERTREGDPVLMDRFVDFLRVDVGNVRENNLPVLRSEIVGNEFSSSRSSMSSWPSDSLHSPRDYNYNLSFLGPNDNAGGGKQCNLDADGKEINLCIKSLDQLLKSESENSSVTFSPTLDCVQSHEGVARPRSPIVERVKKKWLRRLKSMTCVVNVQKEENTPQIDGPKPIQGMRIRRVKVRHCRKKLKEFSALFTGPDIQAHNGLILTMKFSFDGHYLATAGEDKIVKVWKVVEDERSIDIDIPDLDPSCMYFTLNHRSGLTPLVAEKDKLNNSLRKTADSACVIFPPKVFRILETPLHVFQGHTGEVLDISWSKNNSLLSASADNTVRLWQIGCDNCIKVFPHNNYVTSVQFNPVNNDYFMSGSIDGKVRIWGINDCQVVDWIDLTDIVTAVSYYPDGQAGVVGTITGVCRFFNVSGNHMQVEEQVYVNSKKKSPSKRITGFQFFPEDPNKVLVTSADAQVRVLSGLDVVTKCKGPRNGGNFMSASFTSNGNYIISASDDSNVYVWNCTGPEEPSIFESKSIKTFECFSSDASIAIPWCGMNTNDSVNQLHSIATDSLSFSLANDFYLESSFRGSATWPEEKLPASDQRSVMCKSQYKFLKTSCQNLSRSHAWGLVIVTASWDGRIRSFHNYGLPVPV